MYIKGYEYTGLVQYCSDTQTDRLLCTDQWSGG